MAVSVCKPPDAISFSRNAARNWQEFEKQLTWFLAGTESTDKPDPVKIRIMLTHAGKEAREIYKTLLWSEPDDKMKFNKVLKAFKDYCQPQVFINALYVHGVSESAWLSTVFTEGGKITFKLDTGAEASVLPLKVHKSLKNTPVISHTTVTLSAYGGSMIKAVGTCTLMCKGKVSSPVTFYVVAIVVQPILGLTDCIRLGLIQRVHTLQVPEMSKSTTRVEFADVFRELGNLGKYHITLKDQVNPVIHPARRVPYSLLDKLKKCLEANLQCGVLKKVDDPTDWVHNLVIVEKKNGSLRLCLDPRDLNKAVKREHYKIPTVQEISSHLAGKKVFSTLDLKDGYWQIELDKPSSLLCTFNTPFGHFRFTRMPF